jgi:predicted helicase
MQHMLHANRCLLVSKQQAKTGFQHIFCAAGICDHSVLSVTSREITSVFPLFLYEDSLDFNSHDRAGRSARSRASRPNLSATFLKVLSDKLGVVRSGPDVMPSGLTPEDIFHYAYGVLHSPGYRSRYAEFLKVDFPHLPLTGNLDLFRALAGLGGELSALHLLESPKLETPITEYLGARSPEVEKISWSKNTVWLDKAQTTGFKGVREDVWNFHIGGYQVCEKWLKDRKGRNLSADDRTHYQKIVVALSETIRLMTEIDAVIQKHGGWPLK